MNMLYFSLYPNLFTNLLLQISYWEAFKIEIVFSLKVWVNQKKVRHVESVHSRAPSRVREEEWEWKKEETLN